MGPLKDFVRDVWKIAAWCATGAFLLSLVIGLIAGNPFGIALFRAFLLAVLFGGLAAGVRFLVKAYLPELLEANGAPAGDRKAATESAVRRGGAVDIVLAEDDELRRQTYAGARGAGSAASARAETDFFEDESDKTEASGDAEEALEAESVNEDAASEGEAQPLGELAEELAEELPPANGPAGTGRDGAEEGEDGAEEVEPEDGLPGSAREASGGLDSLPDIAALEPSEETRARPVRRMPMHAAGENPRDALRDSVSEQDPLTLARAIRTALKKDEKG